MLDLIIIGAGPAGITAAVYAARKKLNVLVISEDIGGQTAWSGEIENYTGYQFITGPELTDKFEEHLRQYNVELKEPETAVDIHKKGSDIVVKTNKGTYQAKTAIIASGKRSRELGVPGEQEFKNKGLTYCATCDGPLFAGKDVAIIGGGNSALDAALQLVRIANKVYIVNTTDALAGDAVMRDKVQKSDKVATLNSSRVTAVLGDKMVDAIKVKTPQGEKKLDVGGIFVEIGLVPNSGFAKDIQKNENGEILVDCYNKTNTPGIFAAGDVTNVPEKQIIIAAGEGAKASLGAFRYISREK